MIADLKPYPAYKNSGVPSLGEIPAHWEVKRQRNVVDMLVSNIDKHTVDGQLPVRLCNYVDVYKNERITEHLSFMRATASLADAERFRLQVGDVIITKDSEAWNDIGVPALVEYAAPDLVCGYHLAILRPRRGIVHGSYLLRALQSQGVASQYYVSANGVTRYGLSHDAMKSVLVPIPPPDEQHGIIRYLDHVDRRIRRFIRAKQKLIALLEEQKQAIIHQAVTRGLDPNVRLKPSGVEWLGDVPEHWEVLRSKYLFREIDSRSLNGDEIHLSMSQKFGLIPSTEIEEKRLLPASSVGGKLCDRGDLVLNRLKAHLGVFALASQQGIVSPDYTVFRPISEMVPQYFEAVYRTPACRVELRQRAKGIVEGFWRLYTNDFYDIRVPVPPVSEQREIVERLDIELSDIARAIDRTEHEIALLREYRTRLIADVVTGQVDVREAAAQLADETELDQIVNEEEAQNNGEEELELAEEGEEIYE